ncbi:MAG: thioredoxin-disulfide reductase [Tissierellia bacterium]|nr:thioredoxin-disulfide reductase [Tissierellia bacterium]
MYDVIIIGAGPAGLTAGIYASRAKLKTLIIEKSMEGGQIVNTMDVENYPGINDGETGMELAMRMTEQTKKFGAEFVTDEVTGVSLEGKEKVITCANGEYRGKTVIIGTGAKSREIGVPGEEEFKSKGISYCATCDAAFYQDSDVYVIGGGDAAVEEALFIAKFAKNVFVVHRRDELRAAKSIQEKAFANDKIHFIWDTVTEEIIGDKVVEGIVLKNVKTGEITTHKSTTDIPSIGIFVYIGYIPQTQLYENVLELEKGYIVTDENMKTNVEGVFAIGDTRAKAVRQVVTAVADGCIAAIQAEKYIENLE